MKDVKSEVDASQEVTGTQTLKIKEAFSTGKRVI